MLGGFFALSTPTKAINSAAGTEPEVESPCRVTGEFGVETEIRNVRDVIPQEIIESIRDRTSISEVIGQTIKLERRGRSLVGLCPFHREKTPSFHVNEDRGRYHCFGCQVSGDVFRFVQEIEGLSFIEAVRALGERTGVEVVDDLSQEERRQRAAARRREQGYFDVNAAAANYFEQMLVEHPLKEFAHAELGRRGLNFEGPHQETLKAFRIGYAPDGWDGLVGHLKRLGLDLRSAEAVGLIAPRKTGGGHYDRFRHRLMFAVVDLQGRVVAFSGRALPPPSGDEKDESPAKYINSPESPIYKKRSTVFGLYQARQSLRSGEPAVVVEGNFDVVSLHARGFHAAVAPLGTAFTTEQGKNIRRFTSEVIFLFDGDKAGRAATAKARGACKEADLVAKVAQLPPGMDPDDFSRERGPEALQSLLRASKGMLDYLIAELLDDQFAASDAEARGRKINQVAELLASEEDPTVRALAEQHADTLAARLGVADARTFRALRASVQKRLQIPRDLTNAGRRAKPEPLPPERRGESEIGRRIIGALLDFPELLDSDAFMAYATDMRGDVAAVVACMRGAAVRKGAVNAPAAKAPSTEQREAVGVDMNQALAKMPDTVRPFVEARLAAPLHVDIEHAKLELLDNLKKLQRMEFSRLSASTLSELERARAEGNTQQEDDLLREQQLRARRRRGME